MSHSLHSLLVLYGSQTGNAQEVAERIARDGERRGFQPRLSAMDDYALATLPEEVCVSLAQSRTVLRCAS
jgi:sulfite reductase alpha subunit-like flavoprotein